MCQKHRRLFDLEHLRVCDEIEGCPDIQRFAKRIKEGENIRDWEEDELLQCIGQYTSLALQLDRLTKEHRATINKTLIIPKKSTGKKRGRPPLKDKIASTNTKVDQFFQKKKAPIQTKSGGGKGQESKRNKKVRFSEDPDPPLAAGMETVGSRDISFIDERYNPVSDSDASMSDLAEMIRT